MDGGEDLAEGLRVFVIPTRLQLDLTYALPSILILTRTFGLLVMTTTDKVDLDSLAATDPKKAEAIYKSILQGKKLDLNSVRDVERTASAESKSEGEHDKEARLKEQESALVKLAELYRDQKSVPKHPQIPCGILTLSDRNANGLAEVITMSRAFMSSTAKAKTAKLSESLHSISEVGVC